MSTALPVPVAVPAPSDVAALRALDPLCRDADPLLPLRMGRGLDLVAEAVNRAGITITGP